MTDWFHRVGPGYHNTLSGALEYIPEELLSRLSFQFMTDTSPHYAGLHFATIENSKYGYLDVAHCQIGDRYQKHTVVLPRPLSEMERLYSEPLMAVVAHEVGHVLDFSIPERPEFQPVTEYATSNSQEAFAEAFMLWSIWPDALVEREPRASAFFDYLCDIEWWPSDNYLHRSGDV